jgi:hypothetical protein
MANNIISGTSIFGVNGNATILKTTSGDAPLIIVDGADPSLSYRDDQYRYYGARINFPFAPKVVIITNKNTNISVVATFLEVNKGSGYAAYRTGTGEMTMLGADISNNGLTWFLPVIRSEKLENLFWLTDITSNQSLTSVGYQAWGW